MTHGNIDKDPRQHFLPLSQLFLWCIALIGYFGAWVTRRPRSAALSWTAYELFNLLRFLPEIETGAISANLHSFRLPLLGLAMILPLLADALDLEARVKRYILAAVMLLSGVLCMMTLPPYPEILTAWNTPGWRVAFWWAIVSGCAVIALTWLPLKNTRLRAWSIISVLLLTGLPALITRQRLIPALVNLHQAPVYWGPGLWLWLIATGVILLVQWVGLFRKG